MKGWILGALTVTFFAGMSTGVLIGQKTAPDPTPKDWVQGCVDQLEASGVTDPADLQAARKVYENYRARVLAFRMKVDELLRDQLQQLADEAEQEIRAIRAKYGKQPEK